MTLKLHKWHCENCETRLFLRVDDQEIKDLEKLVKFEFHVTFHCIMKNHIVVHKEKEEVKTKFV